MTVIDQIAEAIFQSFSDQTKLRMFEDLKQFEFDNIEKILCESSSNWPHEIANEVVHQIIYNRVYDGLESFMQEHGNFEEVFMVDAGKILFPEFIIHLNAKRVRNEM